MTVKLLTKQLLEFLSLKGGCRGLFGSTLVKCHIVENHMSQLKCTKFQLNKEVPRQNPDCGPHIGPM